MPESTYRNNTYETKAGFPLFISITIPPDKDDPVSWAVKVLTPDFEREQLIMAVSSSVEDAALSDARVFCAKFDQQAEWLITDLKRQFDGRAIDPGFVEDI